MSNFKSLFNSTEYINNQDFYLQNDNFITCCICHGFLVNPLECLKCQTAFCKDCLNSWGDNNKTNPLCPFRCGGKNFTKPHKNTLQQLDKLIIKCFKCSKLVNYNKIESHIEKYCDKIMIECPNQGCTEKMTKALLEEHSLICDYGNTECEECGHTTIRKNKIKLIEMSRKKIYEKNKEIGMFCREISELKDKIEEVEKERQKFMKNSEKYKGEIEILNKKCEDMNKKNQNPKNNKEIIKMNENLKILNESLSKENDNLKKRYEILINSILEKKWYAKLYQRNINGHLKDRAKGYVTLKKEQDEYFIEMVSEINNESMFNLKLTRELELERQTATVLTWKSKKEEKHNDTAISFNSKEDIKEIWNIICSLLGRNPEDDI